MSNFPAGSRPATRRIAQKLARGLASLAVALQCSVLTIPVLVLGALAALDTHAVPNPVIIGPIPATAPPGDPSRNYPFLATILIPSGSGYVEEEFFMQGTAKRYTYNCAFICDMPSSFSTARVVDSGHPYKVRMVVRRPTDP